MLKPESVARLLDLASIPSDSRRSPEICRALSLRNRAALELLYGLGVRRAEVSRARVGDLDQEQATFLVRRVKRGAHQHVPVPTASMPHLLAYLAEGRPFLAWNREDRGRFLVTERGTRLRRPALRDRG
ncbi:MAG: tyrosine-type recombinase/integrase [Planctomycetota bacterium]